MKVVEATREIRCRQESDENRLIRIMLEERCPLRVELEAAAAEGGLIYRTQQTAGSSIDLMPEAFDDRVLYWTENQNLKEVLLRHGGALVHLQRGSAGSLGIEVVARELKAARQIAQEFAAKFGRQKETEDSSQVCVSFWRDSSPQPDSNERFLDTVRWKDIAAGYTATTAGKLDRLMTATSKDLAGGRLMLWHGKPGTGKTYAIRALARQWKPWCDIHYITDPEALLGRAAYLLHLILQDIGDENRWRLLIMEDTGELLSMDAKHNVGQALSRLLNTTEGLIGQGLRVLFLITTNDELGKLNPAVTRHGRCLSAIEFAPLTRAESRKWLMDSGQPTDPPGALTLSELYAITSSHTQSTPQARLGFVAGRG